MRFPSGLLPNPTSSAKDLSPIEKQTRPPPGHRPAWQYTARPVVSSARLEYFREQLADHGNVAEAARATDLSAGQARRLIARDASLQRARDEGRDREARRRHLDKLRGHDGEARALTRAIDQIRASIVDGYPEFYFDRLFRAEQEIVTLQSRLTVVRSNTPMWESSP